MNEQRCGHLFTWPEVKYVYSTCQEVCHCLQLAYNNGLQWKVLEPWLTDCWWACRQPAIVKHSGWCELRFCFLALMKSDLPRWTCQASWMLSWDYTAIMQPVRPQTLPLVQSSVQLYSLSSDKELESVRLCLSDLQGSASCRCLDRMMPGTVADHWSVEARSLMLYFLSTWKSCFDVDIV